MSEGGSLYKNKRDAVLEVCSGCSMSASGVQIGLLLLCSSA